MIVAAGPEREDAAERTDGGGTKAVAIVAIDTTSNANRRTVERTILNFDQGRKG